jgi:hypothetical protein
MTISSLTELVNSEALTQYGSRDTITHVKAAAIRELEALDERLRIRSTDYFNHSFAPDLVLSWPHRKADERYVYLRSTNQAGALSEDVARLGDQHPIVFGLVPIRRDQNGARVHLASVAKEHDTLVTDPSAISHMARVRQRKSVTGLFAAALPQGGRGLLGEEEVARATTALANGFTAAHNMGTESVLRAIGAVDDFLSESFAENFTQLLHAVWIGSGERSDLFPSSGMALTDTLQDEVLEFLLELEHIPDSSFWRNIGRATSVSQIGRLDISYPNENLQLLVKANLDHLRARVCRVQDRAQQLDEAELPEFWWLTEHQVLGLRSKAFVAFVAENTDELAGIEGTPTDGVSVNDLRERTRDTILTGLQLSDGYVELDMNSIQLTDVVRSDQLGALEHSLGSTAKVRRAKAISRSRQVICDFFHSSAFVPTASPIHLSDLLGVGLPLLRSMANTDLQALRQKLQSVDDIEGSQPSLPFDMLMLRGPDGEQLSIEGGPAQSDEPD